MPYRSINTERKAELILEYLKGARICSLAREYGINEDSIHLWKNKVLQALSKILSSGTHGTKLGHLCLPELTYIFACK